MARKTSKTSRRGSASAPSRPTAAHRIVVLHGKEAHLRALHTEALRQELEASFGDVETIRAFAWEVQGRSLTPAPQ